MSMDRLRELLEKWRNDDTVAPEAFGSEVAYAVYIEARKDCAAELEALVRSPREADCICEIDRHDFNCPVHNAGEPPRE